MSILIGAAGTGGAIGAVYAAVGVGTGAGAGLGEGAGGGSDKKMSSAASRRFWNNSPP